MYCDDKFDYWIDVLCTCESYWECEWHKRLRGQYETRDGLGEEMEEVVQVSHAVYMGVIDPPPGWTPIRGRNADYWERSNP